MYYTINDLVQYWYIDIEFITAQNNSILSIMVVRIKNNNALLIVSTDTIYVLNWYRVFYICSYFCPTIDILLVIV